MAEGGGAPCMWEGMNSADTTSVTVQVLGEEVRLSQNPNSSHLGTTVWPASIVLAKMLEKGQRKGEFSRANLAGKHALELGAGMGLGGIALALLGADVTSTDVADVLPLLRRNVESNLGTGKVRVCELDWMQPEQVAQLVPPPFDLVVAADCIYHEDIVPHFHRVVMATTSHKSTVLVVNELRSHSVHAAFMDAFGPTHVVKRVRDKQLDDVYRHPLIHVYLCKRKRPKPCRPVGEPNLASDGADDDQAYFVL